MSALNRSVFLVSCELMSLFLEKSWWIDFGTSSWVTLNIVIPILSIKILLIGNISRLLNKGSVCARYGENVSSFAQETINSDDI